MKPDKYKDVITVSLKTMVTQKRAEVNAFVIMNNHIHLVWQIQEGYERDAVQRNFLKFTSQTITPLYCRARLLCVFIVKH